eukprot:6014204-Amphidinium_carterae.2
MSQTPLSGAHSPRRAQVLRSTAPRYLLRVQTVAYGSRLAPLRARVAALLTRLTQSVFDLSRVRFETFVDDPMPMAYGGHQGHACQAYSATLLQWSCYGLLWVCRLRFLRRSWLPLSRGLAINSPWSRRN